MGGGEAIGGAIESGGGGESVSKGASQRKRSALGKERYQPKKERRSKIEGGGRAQRKEEAGQPK